MSFIIALGNTFPVKDELKSRLQMKFDFDHKVWYRTCLQDKFWYWQQTVESLGQGISCVWVADLSQIVQAKIVEAEVKAELPKPEIEIKPHEYDGAVFEMKAWYAKAFQEKQNTAYAFRNLKILKVKRETAKAIQVDAEFFSGIACSCGVCGKALTNDISRATGIGPICAGKIGLPRPTMETAKEIVAQLESLSKAQGEFHDIWIPKSQIRQIIGNGVVTQGESSDDDAQEIGA